MSEEDWDKDEYVPQPLRYESEETERKENKQKERGRGRGGSRGGRNIRGGGDRGRGRGGFKGTEYSDSKSSETNIRGRGGRGRGGGDHSRNSDNNNSNRGRGRGSNSRGGISRGGHSTETTINGSNKFEESENWDDDDDGQTVSKTNSNEERTPRGMTPPRGARGRNRSASGRFSESKNSSDISENKTRPRGRGMGRGHSKKIVSRSDGEDSEKDDDHDNKKDYSRGRGRGRGRLLRSRSFRAPGGRGGWGGRGGKTKEEERKPERYIPPEPTEDEDVMFHSGITSGAHFNKYDAIGVDVTGDDPPSPINSFSSAGLRPILLENIVKSDYNKPTPIQKNAIPIIGCKRDLMACAQTGSGKTAAFLIPVINDLLSWRGDLTTGHCIEPLAVILSPTRELAIQIFQEARKFAHGSILKIALVYGGTEAKHQLNQISKGCHILVAVPGRLENFVKSNHVKFSSIQYFILDEADRMLELGFKETVKWILTHPTMTPQGQRCTLMFSATFPQEIQELASNYLHHYLFLAVGVVGGACSDVQQLFHSVTKFNKRDKLLEVLKENMKDDELTLVFVSMKRHADFLAVYLCDNDLPTTSIHGDRYQSQREEALADFKAGRRAILIATAVAARGLDIKNVSHVINYDLPTTIEEYVHRIGRTGRVGNSGKSTSFFDSNTDKPLAKDLVKILLQANQPVPEFLNNEAADCRYQASGLDEFSGTDIRTAGSYHTASTAQEEEENWD